MEKSNEIISSREIGLMTGMTADNVRRSYKNVPRKAPHYKALEIGAFCMMNDLSLEHLYEYSKFKMEIAQQGDKALDG